MSTRRRDFLALAASLPAALALAGTARAAAPCYDPAALPLAQKSRRRSLAYVEVSADPKRQCGACAFFKATQPGCGTCTLLSNGPVNAGAVCRLFAAKAK